jgi:hypothetical protein
VKSHTTPAGVIEEDERDAELAATEHAASEIAGWLMETRAERDAAISSAVTAERERDAAVARAEAAEAEVARLRVRMGLMMRALAGIEHPNVRAAVMTAIQGVRGV